MVQEQTLSRGNTHVKTILIVTDDSVNGDFYHLAITSATPHRVVLVHTGVEALNVVKHITPHLLLLDYLLPDMNGLNLYDQLNALTDLATVPTIIVTADLPEYVLRAIRNSGVVILSKPFDLSVFLHTLAQALA